MVDIDSRVEFLKAEDFDELNIRNDSSLKKQFAPDGK